MGCSCRSLNKKATKTENGKMGQSEERSRCGRQADVY